MLRIGPLFSGVGGLGLGLEWAGVGAPEAVGRMLRRIAGDS